MASISTLCLSKRDTDLIHSRDAWKETGLQVKKDPDADRMLCLNYEQFISMSRISVVDKTRFAPTGNPHDYVSQGPYWWPDPMQPSGLPYIKKDGERNPELLEMDRKRLGDLTAALRWIVLSQFCGRPQAENHAARFLKGWFIDSETRMNPHLEFAQCIPGICQGRGMGIIDTVSFCWMLDAVVKLPLTDNWSDRDLSQLREWFANYLDWLLNSSHGKAACTACNNHGTWFDAQVAVFALFCGEESTARRQIESFSLERIEIQITPEGFQPHEMKRALSQHYCVYNLTGFAIIAQIAAKVGLDVWSWRGAEGQSLEKAVRWMLPFLDESTHWPGEQIKPFEKKSAAPLLFMAAEGCRNPEFSQIGSTLALYPWDKITWIE